MPPIEPLLMLLRVAKEVSTELPVPGLSTALEIALSIAEKAKEVKDTRDGCRSLAERAAYFAWGVYDQLKHCDSDTQSIATKEHVKLLLCMLCDIEGLMKRRRRMRALTFLRRHGDVAEDVRKLSTQLEDAIKLFIMQTGIDIEQKMDVLMSTNVRLLQHVEDSARVGDALLWEARDIRIGVCDLAQRLHGSATYDGNFRLFSRENLDLIEPIDNTAPWCAFTRQADEHALDGRVAQQQPGRVVRYRAAVKAAGELSGTQVVVHMYPTCDKSGFMEAVTYGRQICNPYILAMLGYSRPGTLDEASYIVTEDCSPLAVYFSSLRGTGLLRAILKMTINICMAVDHLEMTGLRHRVLREYDFWIFGVQYEIAVGDLVFDHHQGGRVKWARNPLFIGEADDTDASAPATFEDRVCLLDALRPIVCASADEVVQYWFSPSHIIAIFLFSADLVPGRTLRTDWQVAMDCPNYPLGVWLGRTHNSGDWTVVYGRVLGYEVITTSWKELRCLPRGQVSSPEVPTQPPQQEDGDDDDDDDDDDDSDIFNEKMDLTKPLDVPELDRDGMGVDFVLAVDGTRWKRYRFSYIPVGPTIIAEQMISLRGDPGSRMAPQLVPGSFAVAYKNICMAVSYKYVTETTVAMAAHAAESTTPRQPLWFFVLQFADSGGNQGAVRSLNVPCGFWSLEAHPASIPADIIHDPTPQYERVGKHRLAPLSTWKQAFGDLVFTIQTKMCTMVLGLGDDEMLAFRELQKIRGWTSDSHLSDEEVVGVDVAELHNSGLVGLRT